MQHTGHLRQNEQDQLRSKIRRTCENYYRIKIPYQYQEIIKKLSNKKDIIILRQNKGRGVVVLNRTSYIEWCSNILTSDQFKVFENDPTKTLESKVQRVLRKIKHVVDEKLYKRLYPTPSKPGSFYGTAKVHKLKEREGVDKLTLRPIISNTGTATYEITRYLAELLAPPGKSHAPIQWKWGSLKNLIQRSISICSNIKFNLIFISMQLSENHGTLCYATFVLIEVINFVLKAVFRKSIRFWELAISYKMISYKLLWK